MAATATDSRPFGRWTETRSKLANTLKADPSADVSHLRRQMKAERLADWITRQLDSAPSLTPSQRQELAQIIEGRSERGGRVVA